MNINIDKTCDVKIIEIIGRLDSSSSPEAQKEIMPAIDSEKYLILNMVRCEYVSSAGLRLLLMMAKTLARQGGKAVLSGLCEEIRDVMEMTGFGDIFTNYDTNAEALAAIREDIT